MHAKQSVQFCPQASHPSDDTAFTQAPSNQMRRECGNKLTHHPNLAAAGSAIKWLVSEIEVVLSQRDRLPCQRRRSVAAPSVGGCGLSGMGEPEMQAPVVALALDVCGAHFGPVALVRGGVDGGRVPPLSPSLPCRARALPGSSFRCSCLLPFSANRLTFACIGPQELHLHYLVTVCGKCFVCVRVFGALALCCC